MQSPKNKESSTLLWFDAKIGSHEDTEVTKQQLRRINDFVLFHTDLDECVKFIQSISKEKIFLIISGAQASQLLPLVSHLCQVDCIFIFCMKTDKYQHLINEYSKIIGIYTQLDQLCLSIREEIDLFHKQLHTFSIFDHHHKSIKDLSKQSAEFLWFQLFHHIIVRLSGSQQAKEHMLKVCRHYYRGNKQELKLIDEFEQQYTPQDAIRWYSKQSFLYRLVNKALRSEDLEQLQTFRFFIGDLSRSLACEHDKMLASDDRTLTVFRGTKVAQEEFEKMKENLGQIISTNGYLSTSRLRSPALRFAQKSTKRTDGIAVLFQIQCCVQHLGRSVIYADIGAFSDYPDEQEVLFDLNASFRLDSIEQDGSVQLVRMTATNDGERVTKDYIELTQNETREKSVAIVFGQLMCNVGEYDKSQKYFEQLLNQPEGEDTIWIEFNIGRALDYKGHWKEAKIYYDRVYDRMIKASPARIKDSTRVINSIGGILYRQGEYHEALEYHQRALTSQEALYPTGHVDIARSLNSIGLVLYQQGRYDEALDYHQQALAMRKQFFPADHVDIARSLNNIGFVFFRQAKYDEALGYFRSALQMQEKVLPSNHLEIAKSLNNIGNILENQGQYEEALAYHRRALKMRQDVYPVGHVEITKSQNNIGNIYVHQGKYDEALELYQQALEMRKQFHPTVHSDIPKCINNIGYAFFQQGRLDEALDCHQRALEMREELFPSGHIDIARSLNNIGLVLVQKGKYNEALIEHRRALEVCEAFFPTGHVDTAQSLSHIGSVFYRCGKHVEALVYHQRALEMQERFFSHGHVDVARSLTNIGLILNQQGKYDQALEYHQQALKMREILFPSGHGDIGVTFQELGSCYEDQGDKKMALEYYEQASKMYERTLPVGHPNRVRTERAIYCITGKRMKLSQDLPSSDVS